MSPAPMQSQQPRAYTPPPQTYQPPPQQAYTPPPPRPPVLPPVQRMPPPQPQPQVIQVPYAVPVHQRPQYRPRKKNRTGPIIALVIVAVLALCCYGTVFKPSLTSWLFGDAFTDLGSEPTMHGSVPSAMASFFDPWKPALKECWVNDPGELTSASGPIDDIASKIDKNANTVYCEFTDSAKSDYYVEDMVFVDKGGKTLVGKAATVLKLTETFEGSGKVGGEFPSNAAIDGSYSSATSNSDEFALVIAGGSTSESSDLSRLFQKYAAD